MSDRPVVGYAQHPSGLVATIESLPRPKSQTRLGYPQKLCLYDVHLGELLWSASQETVGFKPFSLPIAISNDGILIASQVEVVDSKSKVFKVVTVRQTDDGRVLIELRCFLSPHQLFSVVI